MEIFRRDTLEKQVVNVVDAQDFIIKLLEEIQKELFKKAKLFQEKNTYMVNDFNEFKEKINLGGLVLAHWDGTSETEDKIKKLTKATIRCIPINSKKEPGKCVFSSKPSLKRVVFAKSY